MSIIHARRGPALVVLCFVQFMLVLDDTVVTVALPSIREDLGFGATGLAWVVNAYFLAFGGLLLLCGRVADLWGRRRTFLTGVVLFGAASLVCGLAQEPWQLVTARFVQGAGSAMASPAALSLITLLFPGGQERARALGIWGGIAGLGGTTGVVISGAVTDLTSWRWIFLINLPVAAAALMLPRLVPESRAPRRTRLDVPGAVLGTGAVVALVHGLLRAGESGWHSASVIGSLVLAVALGATFLVVESRTAEPLAPLAFLASRSRAVANTATLLFSAAFYAMAFLLMIHLQTMLGYGPLQAGVAYLPYGAGILVGMWLCARALTRFGARRLLIVSFLVCAAGLLLLSGVSPGDGYVLGVLPGMLVTSIGCGLTLPALTGAAVSGTTEENAGLGAAVFSSVQQVGGAVGVAVLVTLSTRHGDPQAGFSFGLWITAGLVIAGAVLVTSLPPPRNAASAPVARIDNVSEITTPRRRRRRTDADRSVSAILRSAREILATQPNASVEDVATAAGVSRQTVYAHFRTRDALIGAVIDDVTREAVAEMEAARLDEGPAADALLRLLDASWRSTQRYPRLMAATATMSTPDADSEADHDRHQAVLDLLDRILTRGQQAGEFNSGLDTTWLATAIVSLGHAAGEAANAGRMTIQEATDALATSALRLCGATRQ